MELELVQEFRRVATDEVQKARRAFDCILLRTREVEAARQPRRLVRQMLEQHRPAFGYGVVAETLLFHREIA